VYDPTARPRVAAALPRTLGALLLALAGLLPAGILAPALATAAAPATATTASPINPKVVIVAGPVGAFNRLYKSDADALAKAARKYTTNVVLIKTPNATWPAVKAAAQGASILVYLGHGNGWPSRYRDALWPFSQDGFGLDPVSGADGSAHVYYGEAQVGSEIRLAPNAVVLLFHLCYASGNTEPGLSTGTLAEKKQRVDNYGAGFFAAGARAVIADAYHPNVTYIDRLFRTTASMNTLFHGVPSYHGHDIAWDSFRTAGAKIVMDPTSVAKGPYYHSIVYDPGLTTTMVTRTAYPPTDGVPGSLVVPGAATTLGATDVFSDPTLASPAGTIASGTHLRLLAEAPALPDGSRVIQVQASDGGLAGYVRGDALAPADSTPARLYDYDLPGSLIGPNGDYVFDTFRVIVRASEPLDGTVEIRAGSGALVKTIGASDAWSVFDWDLRDGAGNLIPDGQYIWSYQGSEPWGNNPAPFAKSGTFDLDSSVPSTTAAASGTLHPTGWFTTAATVRLTGRDAFSGLRGTWYQLDGGKKQRYSHPFAIAASGDHQVDYWSVDRAGNVEPTRSLEVKVDVSPPITTAVLTGPVGEPGFYRGDVTVGLNATDAQSGVAGSEIGVDGAALGAYVGPSALTGDGVHTVAFRSTDRTGRHEATKTVTFTIDRTAPTLGSPGVVVPSTAQFSPNGDGLADTITISHGLTEPGAIRLVVTPAAGGTAVRTTTIRVPRAGSGTIPWDGRDDHAAYVPDGDYTLSLTPLDRARNAGPSQSVAVSVFGSFVGLASAPYRFFPQDSDSLAPRTVAAFSLKSPAVVTVRIVASSGAIVRTIAGTYPAGPVTIAWNGRTDSGAYAPQSGYRVVVVASAGGKSETHTTSVRAGAFELRPSVTSGRRGQRLTVTVITSEPLKVTPRMSVHQPGLTAYSVKLIRIGPSTWRATWILHSGGRAGTMTMTVVGTDRLGGRNASSQGLRIR